MSKTTSRILRALLICAAAAGGPALADAGCSLKQVASLPSRFVNNEILVDLTVDDAPVSFVIDTGAGASLIGLGLATRLNLPVRSRPGAMYGATGAAENNVATVHSLQLGRMVAHNQSFFVDANFGDGKDGRPAGILGADFLGSYDFEIDLAGHKFNLYLQDHCPDRVVYWDKEYFKIPFTHGDGRVPRIDIPVSIDGQPLRGVLDTGANHTLLRLAVARARLNYDETAAGDPSFPVSGAGSVARLVGYRHQFSSLEFGPITLRNPRIDLAAVDLGKGGSPDMGSHINSIRVDQPDILVGMDVISKLRLYIDYADSALYFTLAEPTRADP
jgi:predicted aspartyl protease